MWYVHGTTLARARQIQKANKLVSVFPGVFAFPATFDGVRWAAGYARCRVIRDYGYVGESRPALVFFRSAEPPTQKRASAPWSVPVCSWWTNRLLVEEVRVAAVDPMPEFLPLPWCTVMAGDAVRRVKVDCTLRAAEEVTLFPATQEGRARAIRAAAEAGMPRNPLLVVVLAKRAPDDLDEHGVGTFYSCLLPVRVVSVAHLVGEVA